MLEKIGLQGGNNWVVDGTHCQGCSSQFTFIYRKHHCRRCGGLFCNACTRQRMVLCGHGDSPVRICEPCKKLEEAARFEMRHGHENITRRGGSKLTSRHEDEVVNQILGNENKELVSSGECSTANMVSALKRDINSASFSNVQEVATHDEGDEIPRSISVEQPNQVLGERESASPEELRQQALDEKKRYKILKAGGKSEEALKAFKRGKELERQAGDLELLLRKNRKKALSSSNMTEIQKTNVDSTYSGRTNKLSSENGKEKVDLAAELRELGWSDMDLRGADKKPASISLEGELSNLLGEISPKTNTDKGSRGIDKTQVIAHKKKALTLKREGKLAEAKEELKRAKVLEKQLEEQEFLADAEDSDDELSALIRAIDGDKQDSLSVAYEPDVNFDFDNLIGITDDLGVDINFEVTDKDDVNNYATQVTNSKAHNSAIVEKGSIVQSAENPSKPKEADVRNVDGMDKGDSKLAPKSRLTVQKDLLGLKKRALALRREGKLDEADEELKKGKVLEQQLEEMDNASKVKATQVNVSNKQSDNLAIPDLRDDGEGDVTEQDMHDPTYLSLLRNLGWKDEDDKNVKFPSKPSKQIDNLSEQISDSSVCEAANSIPMGVSRRSKGEIQRELLGLKRKALALRRQGEIEEAEEVLKMAKVSEAQLAEMEVPKKEMRAETNKLVEKEFISNFVHPDHLVIEDLGTNDHIEHEKIDETVHKNKKPHIDESDSVLATVSCNDQSSGRQEILALKRKAVALKREGKLAEAREELRQAKLLENNSDPGTSPSDVSNSTSLVPSIVQKEHSPSYLTPKPCSGRDRFKLQQESLGHKRLALKLRREGRIEESEAEFQLAKALEAQLDDSAKPSVSGAKPVDEVGVEDFLDPQLLFALKEIGFEDDSTVLKSPKKPEPIKSVADKGENSSQERIRLEAQIKAEKVKAINLKRAGKQAEALDALRCAKVLEKKLSSLAS
ncbi:Vacuolar protein sorting-associated protein 27 [Camellia lanceoleosa]|uniref:Vacuolar protein sorting-associated protein 27 n=1 Tax=Camellia lanceoleosa TaxID=1840588 RepID=A0ACC0GPM6_9ERIC|nr:Vacuolar protein sorting-associated protein 27 [Camellia lanceoleosa]